jgi:SAM-dependent methyltransferase
MLDRVRRGIGRLARSVRTPEKLDMERVIDRALRFRSRLDKLKAGIPADFRWYPYDSFMNLYPTRDLLKDRYLMDLAAGGPVLDAGCGDGALAFFLESLGAEVHAVDRADTNINGLRGVRALKTALKSQVKIIELDLDGRFTLPPNDYGLALFFGTLYHLKNPFYALEMLASHARHCLLSTRVARFAPGGDVRLQELPAAYLLDADEANRDATNFWIFSEAGLRRILDRSGWEVLTYTSTGDTANSEPARPDRDERAFCLLRSRVIP